MRLIQKRIVHKINEYDADVKALKSKLKGNEDKQINKYERNM